MKEWDYVKLVFRTGNILRFGKCKIASVDFADNYVIVCGGESVYYNKK